MTNYKSGSNETANSVDKSQRPCRVLRSIGAVLAGLLVVIILSIGTDAVLHTTKTFPPLGEQAVDTGFFLLET